MSPGDFWSLTPDEFWLIFEAKRPKQYGRLTEDEAERCLQALENAQAREAAQNGD